MYFIVIDLKGIIQIIRASFMPKEAVCDAPVGTDDLDDGRMIILTVTKGVTTASFDTALRATLRAQKTNEKQQKPLSIFKVQIENLLSQTDWTQISDSKLTPTQITNFATYRQALRTLAVTTVDPNTAVLPSRPVGERF